MWKSVRFHIELFNQSRIKGNRYQNQDGRIENVSKFHAFVALGSRRIMWKRYLGMSTVCIVHNSQSRTRGGGSGESYVDASFVTPSVYMIT